MKTSPGVIDSLENLFSEKSIGGKADAMRRIADLFVSGDAGYDNQQLRVFDDLLTRLSRQIETIARVTLAEQLGIHPHTPPNLMKELASDDVIEVARPVLSQCKSLSDETLVEIANTKGREHLLAISKRETISENVTDVLVERGDDIVVLSAVKNQGARFSSGGYSTLARRSEADESLAIGLFERADFPRQHLVRLFSNASEAVQQKLETIDRRRAAEIRKIVAKVSSDLESLSRAGSNDYRAALAYVHTLRDAKQLDDTKLREFADARKFDEIAIALSLLCELPIQVIERGLVTSRSEMLLVFARAIGLQWSTVRSVFRMQNQNGAFSEQQLEQSMASYLRLKPETARKAIQFYRLRERTEAAQDKT